MTPKPQRNILLIGERSQQTQIPAEWLQNISPPKTTNNGKILEIAGSPKLDWSIYLINCS